MKLYTEEQIKEAIKMALHGALHGFGIGGIEDIIEVVASKFTPIQLPSDEEIHKSSPHQISDSHNSWDIGFHNGWKQGANWMRNKIGGKK